MKTPTLNEPAEQAVSSHLTESHGDKNQFAPCVTHDLTAGHKVAVKAPRVAAVKVKPVKAAVKPKKGPRGTR